MNITESGPIKRVVPPANPSFRPLGHVALDLEDYQNDDSVASRKTATACFASMFVLVSQQGLGIGRAALAAIEDIARRQHNIKTLTLNTLPASVTEDPAYQAKVGMDYRKDAIVNELWYERAGFREYKRAPRYPLEDGTYLEALVRQPPAVVVPADMLFSVHAKATLKARFRCAQRYLYISASVHEQYWRALSFGECINQG